MSNNEAIHLKQENERLLAKIAWLLDRVIVKESGEVHLPCFKPSGKDIIHSLKALDSLV